MVSSSIAKELLRSPQHNLKTVMMSLEQFNSMMETIHLLKNPANTAHLERSIKQYRAGQTKQHDLVDA